MKRIAGLSGWLLAGMAMGAAYFLYQQNMTMRAEVDAVVTDRQDVLKRVEAQAERNHALAETIQDLTDQLSEARAAMQRLENVAQELLRTAPAPDTPASP